MVVVMMVVMVVMMMAPMIVMLRVVPVPVRLGRSNRRLGHDRER